MAGSNRFKPARRYVSSSVIAALCVLVIVPAAADAASTSATGDGAVTLSGHPFFPIGLSWPPPINGTTPSGENAVATLAKSGVNLLRTGAQGVSWTSTILKHAQAWDRTAASLGVYTFVNLRRLSLATPGDSKDTKLRQVVGTLSGDPALAMWVGTDEPWWNNRAPSELQYAYCEATGRGRPSWCAGNPVLDGLHDWLTVEAPRGTESDLRPYTAVTDIHGVDDYPVTLNRPDGDLHAVGRWTATLVSITTPKPVWTTLEICASGSHDSSGNYVLPTFRQERYMLYDAIINGANAVNFSGGDASGCWNSSDAALGWNWTFWNTVLARLIGEINATSQLAPALVDPATTQLLHSSDPSTEVITRQGANGDLWVFAARSGSGTRPVTISGLPTGVTSADVYTENRSVAISGGSLIDAFRQWAVHVYHVTY
jgi:hypothetical protein